jgi:hypothetical protein
MVIRNKFTVDIVTFCCVKVFAFVLLVNDFNVLFMVSKECACSTSFWVNVEVWLLLLSASLCSLYRTAKLVPV